MVSQAFRMVCAACVAFAIGVFGCATLGVNPAFADVGLGAAYAPALTAQGDDRASELHDFLFSYASWNSGIDEYDCANPGANDPDIIDKLMGNTLLVVADYSVYPISEPRDSYEDESMGADPRDAFGRGAYYKRYEPETVEWVARNIFNVSESYIAERRSEGGFYDYGAVRWYYSDGAYYAGWGGIGGPQTYRVEVVSCEEGDGGAYDVAYDLITEYGSGYSGFPTTVKRHYAKMQLKDTAVGVYWSMLRHSASPVSSSQAGKSFMYRLYNRFSGEHFYTSEPGEYANLLDAGWAYEGTGWTSPVASGAPVFRLYNRFAGEHHYTMSVAERDSLVAAGWTDEGIGWYSDDAETVPLFREYNPNEPANNHNYTTDAAEHAMLVAAGWMDEGIAWYGA